MNFVQETVARCAKWCYHYAGPEVARDNNGKPVLTFAGKRYAEICGALEMLHRDWSQETLHVEAMKVLIGDFEELIEQFKAELVLVAGQGNT